MDDLCWNQRVASRQTGIANWRIVGGIAKEVAAVTQVQGKRQGANRPQQPIDTRTPSGRVLPF